MTFSQQMAIAAGLGVVVLIGVGLALNFMAGAVAGLFCSFLVGGLMYVNMQQDDLTPQAQPAERKTWSMGDRAAQIIAEKSELSVEVVKQIGHDFPSSDHQYVIERLQRYSKDDAEIMRMKILELSAGSKDKIAYFVELALKDPQQVLNAES